MTDAPAIPTAPIDREPPGFLPSAEMEAILRETLDAAGVELGTYDEQIVRWVAGWDWSTFAVITSWIARANQQQGEAS